MATEPAFTFAAPVDNGLTPEQLQRKRMLAEALMEQGGKDAPIQSWTQGMARVTDSIMGGLGQRWANDKENYQRQTDTAALLGLPPPSGQAPPDSPMGYLGRALGMGGSKADEGMPPANVGTGPGPQAGAPVDDTPGTSSATLSPGHDRNGGPAAPQTVGALPPDTDVAATYIKHAEAPKGSSTKAYQDVDGSWHIGYGSDTFTGADGRVAKVVPGMQITQEDAERDLARRMGNQDRLYAQAIGPELWAKQSPGVKAALHSVMWNYGESMDPKRGPGKLAGLIKNGATPELVARAIGTLDRKHNLGSRRDDEARMALGQSNPILDRWLKKGGGAEVAANAPADAAPPPPGAPPPIMPAAQAATPGPVSPPVAAGPMPPQAAPGPVAGGQQQAPLAPEANVYNGPGAPTASAGMSDAPPQGMPPQPAPQAPQPPPPIAPQLSPGAQSVASAQAGPAPQAPPPLSPGAQQVAQAQMPELAEVPPLPDMNEAPPTVMQVMRDHPELRRLAPALMSPNPATQQAAMGQLQKYIDRQSPAGKMAIRQAIIESNKAMVEQRKLQGDVEAQPGQRRLTDAQAEKARQDVISEPFNRDKTAADTAKSIAETGQVGKTPMQQDYDRAQADPNFEPFKMRHERASAMTQEGSFATKAGGGIADMMLDTFKGGLQAKRDLANIQQLRTSIGSMGGLEGGLKAKARDWGIPVGKDTAAIDIATSMIDKLVPQQRQGLPGAASDRDMATFRSALPSMWKDPKANAVVADTMEALARSNVAQSDIATLALSGKITQEQALEQLSALPDPMTAFKTYLGETGQTPAEVPQGGADENAAKPGSFEPTPAMIEAIKGAKPEDRAGYIERLKKAGYKTDGM